MLKPILRKTNLSSSVIISKSVGSSSGSRYSCTFASALSAFLSFPFAIAYLFCRYFINEARLAIADSFIIFSNSSQVGCFPQREVAATVSARVPATTGTSRFVEFELIKDDANRRASSS
uniref:Uncharacterized protein n=1 Tax=Opuntia streptacantha TaxID=393608 RepID=A0A7C8ZIY1_OPUST